MKTPNLTSKWSVATATTSGAAAHPSCKLDMRSAFRRTAFDLNPDLHTLAMTLGHMHWVLEDRVLSLMLSYLVSDVRRRDQACGNKESRSHTEIARGLVAQLGFAGLAKPSTPMAALKVLWVFVFRCMMMIIGLQLQWIAAKQSKGRQLPG
jgi:hypothetical protein